MEEMRDVRAKDTGDMETALPANRGAIVENRATPNNHPIGKRKSRSMRKLLLPAVIAAGLAGGIFFLYPWIVNALNTVSTDDAYINGHMTLVAPRVPGQIIKVLVDDNYRVKKGDLLVQIDPEPYQVELDIKKAALEAAQMDVATACAKPAAWWARPAATASRWTMPSKMWIIG